MFLSFFIAFFVVVLQFNSIHRIPPRKRKRNGTRRYAVRSAGNPPNGEPGGDTKGVQDDGCVLRLFFFSFFFFLFSFFVVFILRSVCASCAFGAPERSARRTGEDALTRREGERDRSSCSTALERTPLLALFLGRRVSCLRACERL